MMPALHNYVTTDPTAFIGQRKHLHIVYEMCKKVIYCDCQFVSDAATTGPMKSLTKFMKRLLLFNPNPIGGGGGPLWPPPCHFFRRASRPIGISRSNFMTFFSQVSRIF